MDEIIRNFKPEFGNIDHITAVKLLSKLEKVRKAKRTVGKSKARDEEIDLLEKRIVYLILSF